MVNQVLKSGMVTCSDQMVVIPTVLGSGPPEVLHFLQPSEQSGGDFGGSWAFSGHTNRSRQRSCRLIMVLVLADLILPLPGNLKVLCNCEPTPLCKSCEADCTSPH